MERGMAWYSCSSASNRNNTIFPFPPAPYRPPNNKSCKSKSSNIIIPFAAAARFSNSLPKRCRKCGGRGALDCPGCKGTGKNKKNGNIFERWKCFECQGFGLKSCPECGNGGLTPEQRGER